MSESADPPSPTDAEWDPEWPTGDIEKAEMASIRRDIHKLYDAGVPFFTKDRLRSAMEQIEIIKQSGKPGSVFLSDLNGSTVESQVHPGGQVIKIPGSQHPPGTECFKGPPIIRYHSLAHLTAEGPGVMYPGRDCAYLTLEVVNRVCYRDIATKEVVYPGAPTIAFADAEAGFRQLQTEWEASETCRELRQILESAEIPRVSKIVGFSCGSIWRDGKPWRASAVQNACLFTLRDIFSARTPDGIRCFAQDPLYIPFDKQILEREGFVVVDDPRGFLELDDGTLVFSFNSNVCVREITRDLARPAVMLWNKVREMPRLESGTWTDPTSPRLERMVEEEYEYFSFGSEAKWDHASVGEDGEETVDSCTEFASDPAIYIKKAGKHE